MKILVLIIIFALIALMLYFRLKPINAKLYQYRPSAMPQDGKPHDYRLLGEQAPRFNQDPQTLLSMAKSTILDQPRTKLLYESEEGWLLFQQRTLIMGYPDFISVEAKPIKGEENSSRLEIASRSHYGVSDMGANQKRVEHWLLAIKEAQ